MTVKQLLDKSRENIGKDYRVCNANTDWCQMFVNWLFKDTENDTHSASCTQSVKVWQNKGRFDKIPHIGDIVYFQGLDDIAGDYDHVGIVTNVSSGRIHTIEGNTASYNWRTSKVGEYSYPVNSDIIGGYAHPVYDDVTATKYAEYSTSLVNTQLFAVEILQRMLNHVDTGTIMTLICDGYYGTLTENVVKKYQSTHNLVVDGIAGKNTINSLVKEVFDI